MSTELIPGTVLTKAGPSWRELLSLPATLPRAYGSTGCCATLTPLLCWSEQATLTTPLLATTRPLDIAQELVRCFAP